MLINHDIPNLDRAMTVSLRKEFAGVATPIACGLCHGQKVLNAKPCPNCGGQGGYDLVQMQPVTSTSQAEKNHGGDSRG